MTQVTVEQELLAEFEVSNRFQLSIQVETPAIVIVAFNRPKSLKRILKSVAIANYDGYKDIPLVVSIDKSDCAHVPEIARQFVWEKGPKTIIEHPHHLGLRKHIISCGDLTADYKAIIVLEDDAFVSPAFYDYAVQAMRFYSGVEHISGISLYSYDYHEYAGMRFSAVDDGYDNYFIQSASSLGQLWTRRQWSDFKRWYRRNAEAGVSPDDPVPDPVVTWLESSWKKYFIKYMVLEKKYFVYPRKSHSTNFADPGTHQLFGGVNYQVPIAVTRKAYNFSNLNVSASIYDSHYEIEARCLKRFNPDLESFDFECDFYGLKNRKKVNSEYLLSIRKCAKPIISYALNMLPQELNVIFDLKGRFFCLAQAGDFGEIEQKKRITQLRYLHKDLGFGRYGALSASGLIEGVKRRVKLIAASRPFA